MVGQTGIFFRNSKSWRVGAAAAWRSARRPVGAPRARRRARPIPPILRGVGSTFTQPGLLSVSLGVAGLGAPSSRYMYCSIFVSEFIQAAWDAVRIRMQASTAAHHETVGLAERFNSTLHQLLMTCRDSSADPRWRRYIYSIISR